MSNVYLSFLGTNDYLDCIYYRDGFETRRPVRFVQEATLSFCCRNWGEEDRIIVFTTQEAERKNWVDDGHRNPKTNEVIRRRGLDAGIRSLGLGVPHRNITIPEGYSEAELWRVFQAVYDALLPKDRVTFDITHAFRSIPLVATVALHYAKIMKDVHLEGIYYGAFEVLGSIAEARSIPAESRRVPILELTAMDQLMNWTIATDRFLGSGDATYAANLAADGVRAILRETKGQNVAGKTVRSLTGVLEKFSRLFTTCRGPDIARVVKELREKIDACRGLDLYPPFVPLFERIASRLEAFDGSDLDSGLAAVRWCLDHRLIQQGFTLLEEVIFTHVVRAMGEDPLNTTLREICSQAFAILAKNIEAAPEKWHPPAGNDPTTTLKMIECVRRYPELPKFLDQTRTYRNDLNHAGFNQNALKVEDSERFARRLETILDGVEAVLRS